MYGIVKVAAINCGDEEELCEEFNISDVKSKITIQIYSEERTDQGLNYKGELTAKALAMEANHRMISKVEEVNQGNYKSFIE